jgi:hypothetical protein
MFLKLLRPLFPFLERLFRPLRTDARQEFLLGTLPGEVTAVELQHRLTQYGFEPMLFAWVDDGQILSLRKRDGDFQYHLRIFNDGEVRGHYEYAPEVAPIKHLRRIAREAKTKDFFGFLGEQIVINHATMHHNTFSNVMQPTFEPSYRA